GIQPWLSSRERVEPSGAWAMRAGSQVTLR
ncbi:MAG: hypothetical protein ACI8S6_004425, partial [Myxococcota bacterium]